MDAVEKANREVMKRYTKEAKIGEGTFAVVYKGQERSTGRPIAIKKIKMGELKYGLDMSAVREVKYLRELEHPNIIKLLDVFSTKSNLNLVLEYLDSDLQVVIEDRKNVFQAGDIKSWMAMTLRGLEFCHRNWILHRDLKPNNLLIGSDGQLKLADFGLARDFADPGHRMTCQVITIWYRPPELFFGARSYSTGVDMWSVGCIFAELMLRVPYLGGATDLEHLKITFKALGTPTEEEWPGHASLPAYVSVGSFPKSPLKYLFTAASPEALDLLSKFLVYDPRKRVTAKEALHHPYFTSLPYPTHPSRLPKTSPPLRPRPIQVEEDDDDDSGATASKPSLKRKAMDEGPENARPVARRLDFT